MQAVSSWTSIGGSEQSVGMGALPYRTGFRIGGGQGMIGQPKSPSGIPPYTMDGLVAA